MSLLIFNEQRVPKFTFVLVLNYTVFICNIDRDWMIHPKHPIRSLLTSILRKANIRYPSMYTLSLLKSIKRSNYGEFLSQKCIVYVHDVLSSTAYKYAPNLESLLTQQYVCVIVLWSDNTCVFTRFHSVKNANTQLIWSSVIPC